MFDFPQPPRQTRQQRPCSSVEASSCCLGVGNPPGTAVLWGSNRYSNPRRQAVWSINGPPHAPQLTPEHDVFHASPKPRDMLSNTLVKEFGYTS